MSSAGAAGAGSAAACSAASRLCGTLTALQCGGEVNEQRGRRWRRLSGGVQRRQ